MRNVPPGIHTMSSAGGLEGPVVLVLGVVTVILVLNPCSFQVKCTHASHDQPRGREMHGCRAQGSRPASASFKNINSINSRGIVLLAHHAAGATPVTQYEFESPT